MTNTNVLELNKHRRKKPTKVSESKILNMKIKLEDVEYINGAIYKLASILANRIINGGLSDEEEKV